MTTTERIRAEVYGDRALIRKFEKLEKKSGKKVLSKSVRAGSGPILKAARRLVPVQTKNMKKNLTKKLKFYSDTGTQIAVIGARKASTAKFYVHLVEEGTKSHEINIEHKQAIALDAPFGDRVYKKVQHPGARGSHFIRKASEQAKPQALAQFNAKFATEVVREATTT